MTYGKQFLEVLGSKMGQLIGVENAKPGGQ